MRYFRTVGIAVAVLIALALEPRPAATLGPLVFVLNPTDQRVVVVDIATHAVVRQISLLFYLGGTTFTPSGIAVSPDGRFAYVTSQDCSYISPDGQNASGCFFVISADSLSIVATNTSATGKPGSLVFTPDGREVWIADESDAGRLWVVRTDTNQIDRYYELGSRIASVEVAPDASFVAITQPLLGTLKIIRFPSGSISSIVPGPAPHATVISPDARAIYVATYAAVVAIAADTGTITWQQPTGPPSAYVEALRVGRKQNLDLTPEEDIVLYAAYSVPTSGPGGIVVIDPAATIGARQVLSTTVARPLDMLLNPTTGVLYVASNTTGAGQLLAFAPPGFDSPARNLALGKSATRLGMQTGGNVLLQVGPQELVFLTDLIAPDEIGNQSVRVSDAGGRSFAWQTRTPAPPIGEQQWLKIDPASGPSAPSQITVSVDRSRLPQDGFGRPRLGEHIREFLVIDSGFNSQRTVRVRVVVVLELLRYYFPNVLRLW